MKKVRAIAILLLAAMCVAGCTQSGTKVDDTTESVDTGVVQDPVKTGLLYDTTEETISELELRGYEFNIYLRPADYDWTNHDFTREDMKGDNFDIAVYNRKTVIEETFDCTLNFNYSSDWWLTEIGTLVFAGDDTYDLAFPMIKQAATFATQGYLIDLTSVDYLDLESEVWSQNFINSASIGNKLYMILGDVSTNMYDALGGFLFNKELVERYQLDDPYELVREGKWTLDVFHTMMQTVSSDLTSDLIPDSEKIYGFPYPSSGGGNQLFYGGNVGLTAKDENDIPYLSLNQERAINVFDKVKSIMTDTSCVAAFPANQTGSDMCISIWREGRSLFTMCGLYGVASYRDMDTDFGILPIPKYDENQEDYIQYLDDWCPSPAVIPLTAKNADRSAFLIQLLAETGREFILPEYYEKCLLGKYVRDDESEEMLNIILGSYIVENADLYKWGGLSAEFLTAINGLDTRDIGANTLYATYESQVEAAIQTTLDAFESSIGD